MSFEGSFLFCTVPVQRVCAPQSGGGIAESLPPRGPYKLAGRAHLSLIVFSIIFAGMLTTLPNVDVLKSGIEQINAALMAFVLLLMNIAPIGIFCLVTSRFGEAQWCFPHRRSRKSRV